MPRLVPGIHASVATAGVRFWRVNAHGLKPAPDLIRGPRVKGPQDEPGYDVLGKALIMERNFRTDTHAFSSRLSSLKKRQLGCL
jgi:hypothetical protein